MHTEHIKTPKPTDYCEEGIYSLGLEQDTTIVALQASKLCSSPNLETLQFSTGVVTLPTSTQEYRYPASTCPNRHAPLLVARTWPYYVNMTIFGSHVT